MSYKINSTKINDFTLTTNVTYILTDGTEVTVDVPHFSIGTKEQVISGIENREITEQQKHDIRPILEEIKSEIDSTIGE
jgi:hypothetical protein